MKLKEMELTDLERTVIFKMANMDKFEEMATGNADGISEETEIPIKILRGVLSSLHKKDILMEGEYPDGEVAHHLKNEYNYTNEKTLNG